jgi:hypothetical protein
MDNATRMQADLEALGRTADEVAKNLENLGIKGLPRLARHCPLAKYLISKGYLQASIFEIAVADSDSPTPYQCKTPEPCYDFIHDFDRKVYPQLIEDKDED